MLIVRIFFVGLISFTPTGEPGSGEEWLALLLKTHDRHGVANHDPKLHYCLPTNDPAKRCEATEPIDISKHRLDFDFHRRAEKRFEPLVVDCCDPDRMQAPDSTQCARDYRWIAGARRTMNRQAGRRWCCRDWFVLSPCNSISYVLLEDGQLENCRFVEGAPPTLPERAIYGLSGLRPDGRARVASEISMVKIEVPDWGAREVFEVDFRGLPLFRTGLKDLKLEATPCEGDKYCIDLLVDNRPPALDGLTHRPLVAGHFDLYRRVMGSHPDGDRKVIPQLNEGFKVPLDLQPCKPEESPLLSSELLLGAGNERPICPEFVTE